VKYWYLRNTNYCQSIRQGCFHWFRTKVRGLRTIRYHRSLDHKLCWLGISGGQSGSPFAPCEKSKILGSGGKMVAGLKRKGIDGRAPPWVERAAQLTQHRKTYQFKYLASEIDSKTRSGKVRFTRLRGYTELNPSSLHLCCLCQAKRMNDKEQAFGIHQADLVQGPLFTQYHRIYIQLLGPFSTWKHISRRHRSKHSLEDGESGLFIKDYVKLRTAHHLHTWGASAKACTCACFDQVNCSEDEKTEHTIRL